MNKINKTITMAIVLLCLNINVFAFDGIYIPETETWVLEFDDLIIFNTGSITTEDIGIDATDSFFWIENYGTITALIAIQATGLTNDIVNYEVIDGQIISIDMTGDIFNEWSILNVNGSAIISEYMTGDIYNGSLASIEALHSAIDAEFMIGDIYNDGSLVGDIYGINAQTMVGTIYNFNYIYGDYSGISAKNMIGDIENSNSGWIDGSVIGIDSSGMTGDIYNNDNIFGGSQAGIYAAGMVGNITNLILGFIESGNVGIDASAMLGNIYNENYISGYEIAINANGMQGNIYNGDVIISTLDSAINANLMIGSIYNDGTIYTYSTESGAIYSWGMSGNIWNTETANIFGSVIGINAGNMLGNINNDGLIHSEITGIVSEYMRGDIINNEDAEIAGDEIGINANYMTGNILNFGDIYSYDQGDSTGIYSFGMDGNIENYSGAWIYGIETAINARYMNGWIFNEGLIEGYNVAINSSNMSGSIINFEYATITSYYDPAILAFEMYGNIENYGLIESVSAQVINSVSMEGTIYNAGIIYNYSQYGVGIESSNMSGNIINDGTIITDGYALTSTDMAGSIGNSGSIESYNDSAIVAVGMQGDIINLEGGEIIAFNSALELENFEGTVYNYGLLESLDSGYAIEASGVVIVEEEISFFNLVGNGTIIGNIYNIGTGYDDVINITNDMDTVLDLSDAPLVEWDYIDLLGGEMIITDISGETEVNQFGGYIHYGVENSNVSYSLNSGILNPYSDESSTIGYMEVDRFEAYAGTTIELDFGDEENDRILSDGGFIEAGVTLKFIPNQIFAAGWSEYYLFIEDVAVNEDVDILIPLFYTVTREQWDIQAPSDWSYYARIERSTKGYDDYAHIYNKGFAALLNDNDSEETEDIIIALELVYTASELNDVLESYNMMGYASLANNNVFWINNRIGKLFDLLSGTYGSNAGTGKYSNTGAVGSGYATHNSHRLNRDLHGNHVWFDVYMSDTKLDGEVGFYSTSKGYEAAVGIDKELNASTIIGMSFYINDYDTDVSGGLPVSVDSEGMGLSAYGQFTQGNLSHKWMVGYTMYENESKRLGNKADFDSNDYFAAYRMEYLWDRGSYDLVPILALHYSHITYDDIIEDGSQSGVEGFDYDSLIAEVGIKLYKQAGSFTYNCGVSLLNELMDTETDATAVSGLGSYSQSTIERDDITFRVTAGIAYKLDDQMTLGLDLAREFGDNTGSDSIQLKLTYSF